MKPDFAQPAAEVSPHLFDNWFDPIEASVRDRVRAFIETMIEDELEAAFQSAVRSPFGSGRGLAA